MSRVESVNLEYGSTLPTVRLGFQGVSTDFARGKDDAEEGNFRGIALAPDRSLIFHVC